MGPMAWPQIFIYTAGYKRLFNTSTWADLMMVEGRRRKLYNNAQWVQLFHEKALGAIPFTVVC